MNTFEILEASLLDLPCLNHPLTYLFAWFSRLHLSQGSKGHCLKLAMNVDAVEQGAGNLVHIALNLSRRADTMMCWVAIVPAGAGVHGRDHHEGTGVLNIVLGTTDGNLAVLQGLTQHFEDAARQLRQFTQMEILVPFSRFSEMPIYRGFSNML